VPVNKLTESESEKLLHMEDTYINDQSRRSSSVSKAIRRARVGLKNLNRPIASFVFSGPTGGGKPSVSGSISSAQKKR